MAAADADDATLREFIAVLDAHRKECERECKYVEADIAKRRLAELRALAESREVDTVASRQHAQRQGVEEAQMLEFQQFNTLWDQKFREYDERAAELLDAMRQRHLLDQDEFRKGVEAGPAHRPKASKELLDLRRKQVMVAKQGDYADAQKLKTRADALEAEEAERHGREAEQHALLAEVKFMRRQEQELNALRKRIQTGAEEQRHARELDLERLLQRYQNVKSELEAQQTAERHRQKKGAAGQGLLQSGLGSSASVARRSSAGAIPRRPASAARGATPASRAPGFSAARTPAPPKWR